MLRLLRKLSSGLSLKNPEAFKPITQNSREGVEDAE
jgi:hypothetical protein